MKTNPMRTAAWMITCSALLGLLGCDEGAQATDARAQPPDADARAQPPADARPDGDSAPLTPAPDAAPDTGPDAGPKNSDLPPGQWDLIWSDEFDGASGAAPKAHWMTGMAWASGPRPGDHYWRHAVNSPGECYLDGQGHLVLRARYVSGERRVCYLTTAGNGNPQSAWTMFKPGAKGLYVEYRANVSKMCAHAAWFATWLMSPNNTYDGNPSTGSEIDVMEYVPFTGPNYSLLNLFHAAVFWDKTSGKAEPPPNPPYTDTYGQTSATALGSDLTKDGYHTWGVEWTASRQRFYFNGKLFWDNVKGVSDADHGLRLSIEIENGTPYNLWGHPVGKFEDNPAACLPSYARVDHVRVFRRR